MSSLKSFRKLPSVKIFSITSEVVEPPTRSSVTFTFFSAHRIVTAAFMLPNVAAGRAPFEFARGLCCIWPTTCFSLVGFLLLKRHLAVSGAVPRGAKSGTES